MMPVYCSPEVSIALVPQRSILMVVGHYGFRRHARRLWIVAPIADVSQYHYLMALVSTFLPLASWDHFLRGSSPIKPRAWSCLLCLLGNHPLNPIKE